MLSIYLQGIIPLVIHRKVSGGARSDWGAKLVAQSYLSYLRGSLKETKLMTGNRVVIREVSFNLPFGIGGVKWEVDETQTRAAWSLYVELVTRIAVEPLEADEGLLREALNSLYSLFGTTREILKEAGSDVGASKNSVGGIAIAVLNRGLRPFLSKWHHQLQAYEAKRPPHLSPKEHEQKWSEEGKKLRDELEKLRQDLKQYANALAKIAGVEEKTVDE